MQPFRTILSIPPSLEKITLADPIFTSGSCFADNLGKLLQSHKFDVTVNPFGTSYNPASIHEVLTLALDNEMPSIDSYGELNGTYFNYNFHSSFSSLDAASLRLNIEKPITNSHTKIKSAKVIMITYGTAWVYHRNDNDSIVSNCHKVAASHFSKRLLTQKKILESFDLLYDKILKINPEIRVILTVSPVRHLKDTLELNAVSKSILRLSCHTLAEQYKNVEYFPAYEIVMDDLRDYRFYKADLIHPSDEAIGYIWEKFRDRYFSPQTNQFIEKWSKVIRSLQHRPFLPQSDSHQKFLKSLLNDLEELRPLVNVDKEINQVKKDLL